MAPESRQVSSLQLTGLLLMLNLHLNLDTTEI